MLHFNTSDERTLLTVRKHWFVLCASILGYLILYAAPFVLYDLISHETLFTSTTGLEPITITQNFFNFLGILWTLFIWMRFYAVLTNYYLDIWIITDKRVVAIDQIRFFDRQMSIFRMERIQDVVVKVDGFIETMLNFGDLHVETAGADENFIIKNVPNPARVKDTIMHQHDAAVEGGNRPQMEAGL